MMHTQMVNSYENGYWNHENKEQSEAHAQESQGQGGSGLGFQDAEGLKQVGLLRLQGKPQS